MTRWTRAAEEAFSEYARAARESASAMGADPDESIRDLRRHIEEEAERTGATALTETDLRQMLRAMGGSDSGETPGPAEPRATQSRPGPTDRRKKRSRERPPGWLSFCAGVALPLVTLALELKEGMCASGFFNPLATPWHVLAVGLVPVANFVVWTALRRGGPARTEHVRTLRWINGMALGVASFYTVAFVPLMPVAALAVMFMGLGLLPMAPALSLLSGLSLRRKLSARSHFRGTAGAGTGWATAGGVAVGLALILVGEAPGLVTNLGLRMTASTDEATRSRGTGLLREWGSERELLRACYGMENGPMSVLALGTLARPSTSDARAAFYRVTGEGFNTRPRPLFVQGRGTFDRWDFDLGSTRIGGVVADLDLVESRVDGSIDADAAVGYLEWTWVLENDAPFEQEARAELALPIGAVVSRCTLWIDGEEREAAYAGTRDVREAYESVVAQRRDPLLVTHRAPNSVMVQCFPVPASGRMQIRIGITIPLASDAPGRALLVLPSIVERNFDVDAEHSLWLEARRPLRADAHLQSVPPSEGVFTLRGTLEDEALTTGDLVVELERDDGARQAWCVDPVDGGFIVRQGITAVEPVWPSRLVCVIDTSGTLATKRSELVDWLERVPSSVELGLVLAGDYARVLLEPDDASARERALTELRDLEFRGGAHDAPALTEAWDRAAEVADGTVLWLHGPKPVHLGGLGELVQRTERRPEGPAMLSVQLTPGPNRILADLTPPLHFTQLPGRVLDGATWPSRTQVDRVRIESEGALPQGKETSGHLARLWALGQVRELIRGSQREAAVALAADYRLVTPVTGAVVLESREQYEAAGLEPVQEGTVPSIPEPSFYILLAASLALLFAFRKRLAPAGEAG